MEYLFTYLSATRPLGGLLRFEGVACSGSGGILVGWLLVAVELNGHCWIIMGKDHFDNLDIVSFPWPSIIPK
ncbi:hypothetical protein BYT27DRAFT_7180019 [Phlegmacium glaucopus]|nr:hypothetical protein BYT27DRAFT_7180019 [Phlegmacium glaucopus]